MTTASEDLLKRITARPDVFNGKPIIRDMRISVELILSLLSQGASHEELKDDYPDLEEEDILACIAYAHAVIAGGLPGTGVGGIEMNFLVDRCAGRRLTQWLQRTGTRRRGRQRTWPGPRRQGYSWNGPSPKTGSSLPWTRISVNSSTSTEDRTRG